MNKKENDLLKYFVQKTDDRFDVIDKKLDKLISFRLMLIGGAAVISAIISIFVSAMNH
jgi:hypothetical protein